jgi:signal transduction histidine kinase
MRRWLRLTFGPVFWIVAVQIGWTVALVGWIVYFVDRRSRLQHEGWHPLVWGILLFALMFAGVTGIVVHFSRQVALNRAVKDFVSQVSHDLRSPLTIVKLHLETLRLRSLTPEQRADCLGTALAELGRLESEIEGILTASRIERARLKLAAQPLELKAFLSGYALEKSKAVGVLGGSLTFEPSRAPELVARADPDLLRQLLDNLVDNAFTHCQKGVDVQLSLGEQGRCAVISVSDDGPGLEQKQLRKVFRMFYRAPGSRHSKGTGLGLFIVAGIARAHGGEAWAESPGPGKGCTFRVALPLASVEVAA